MGLRAKGEDEDIPTDQRPKYSRRGGPIANILSAAATGNQTALGFWRVAADKMSASGACHADCRSGNPLPAAYAVFRVSSVFIRRASHPFGIGGPIYHPGSRDVALAVRHWCRRAGDLWR
jgi:hypothetical protein